MLQHIKKNKLLGWATCNNQD